MYFREVFESVTWTFTHKIVICYHKEPEQMDEVALNSTLSGQGEKAYILAESYKSYLLNGETLTTKSKSHEY